VVFYINIKDSTRAPCSSHHPQLRFPSVLIPHSTSAEAASERHILGSYRDPRPMPPHLQLYRCLQARRGLQIKLLSARIEAAGMPECIAYLYTSLLLGMRINNHYYCIRQLLHFHLGFLVVSQDTVRLAENVCKFGEACRAHNSLTPT
jgi:hypothetical protein